MRKSLVLFSGGLDSFLSLLIAIKDGGVVTPIFYNYGQNPYEEEKKAVWKICKKLGLAPIEINLTGISHLLSSSYTTGENASENKEYNVYVPNRNLLFLTLASNYAHLNNYKYIYTGFYHKEGKINERVRGNKVEQVVDNTIEQLHKELYNSGGLPDQSLDFIARVGEVLKLSDSYNEPELINPLVDMDKVDIYSEILKLDKQNIGIKDTYSCYANSSKENIWGVGCGSCNSCWERKRAFEVLNINYGGKI